MLQLKLRNLRDKSEKSISKLVTRSWSAEEKFSIVLRISRGELSVSEASRKHGVSYKTLIAWHDRFLKGGEIDTKDKGPDAQVKTLENEQLKEALAEMVLRLEVLKTAASASKASGTGR